MEVHTGNGVELDVQESLRAILHTQARLEMQMTMVVEGMKHIMIAMGIRSKLEEIARSLDTLDD